MREPRFWSREVDPKSREAAPVMRALLTPFAWAYAEITRRKLASAAPVSVPAIVICVGNLTAGGTGKSPVVSELRTRLESKLRLRVATLSRGYKGRLKGPLKVQHGRHTAAEVGDEPLMLSATGESWIGADRAAAGQAMCEAGVELILMDDGHQNPGLAKDFTLIVVDAEAGFGNGFVIPKGPLREPSKTDLSEQMRSLLWVMDARTCNPSRLRSSPLSRPDCGESETASGPLCCICGHWSARKIL